MATRTDLDGDSDLDMPLSDSGSLRLLYRRHQGELYSYIRKMFGLGPPDPEDVVQAAFTRFAALTAPDAVRNPRAFLFRAAYNLAVDALRHGGRFEKVVEDVRIFERDSHDCGPHDLVASRQEIARLDAVLSRLPEMQRTALLMHRLDDLSFAEIGRRIGYTPAGTRQLVCKAMDACLTMVETGE